MSRTEISEELVKNFATLFQGRVDVWGSVEGRANKEIVTLEHYARHLLGETSLGIYMLLDDGTCHYAVIDLDTKNWNQALIIRNYLTEKSIYAYTAESKSKGYHIFVFAKENEPFIAKDIRRILKHSLDTLKIKAEIFPKQDSLSATVPWGSYTNLPCLGNTRQFLTVKHKEVPIKEVLQRIQHISKEIINKILQEILAEEKPPPKTAKEKQQRERARKHPSCIETILKGVTSPGRDEAAFALARYYLDQQYSPDEISGILEKWDRRNTPPLGDEKLLEIKVKSAEKGYAFGCSSITDNTMLNKFCVGIEECEWLKRVKKPEFKVYFEHRPEIRPALDFIDGKAYITTPMDIDVDITKKVKGETQVIGKKKAKRLVTITSDGEIFPTAEDNFMDRGLAMIGTVSIPKRRWSLNSIHSLVDHSIKEVTFMEVFQLIKQQYKHYMDLGNENIYSFISLWIIGSYFFPLFDAYPYTFFGGDREVGKTKMLTLTQQMAFNSISSGNISTSSIFRLIEGARATLLIDEAEKLGSTDRGQEFKNILNASYKPGNPVFRAEKTMKEQFIVVDFDAYSPKMLANISGLEDVLESRVIPFILTRTLNKEIANREIDIKENIWQEIRDKLYILAMTKWGEVKNSYNVVVAPEEISARNWEIWKPIITIAKVTDITNTLEAEMLTLGIEKTQEKLLEATLEAPDSVLVKVLANLVLQEGYYSVKEIKSRMVETYGEERKDLTNDWIGRAMKRKGFEKMIKDMGIDKKWKHRIGTGVEYLLNPKMVALVAKRMGIDISEGSESDEDIDTEV